MTSRRSVSSSDRPSQPPPAPYDADRVLLSTPPSSDMTPSGSVISVGKPGSGMSVSVVRGLVEAVEHAGVARAAFLRAAKLDLAAFDTPEARLPRAEVYRLCEVALAVTGDPALGLHWAQALTDRMFVPVSHVISHCASLRQALELLARFIRLLSDEAPYRIVEADDKVVLHCLRIEDQSPALQRFVAELTVGGFYRLVRTYDVQARAERVSFEHAAPAYHAEYAQLFGGAECFEQAFTGLVFERSVLDAPSPQQDDDVREALQAVAERRLLRITHSTPWALRVRDHLVNHAQPNQTDMEVVARALDISVRSLRRRLADEGKSYHEVLSEALGVVAKHKLQDIRRTIHEIAYEMGFSEPSTFHRAFKRWTGITPSAFRESRFKPDDNR